MFTIPAALFLMFLVFIRPQAFMPQLVGVPLVHIAYSSALLGMLLDLRLRLIRPKATPLFWPAVAFFVWCIITCAIRTPSLLGTAIGKLFVPFALFFIVGHAIQSLRALRVIIVALVAIGVFLAFIGVEQHFAPQGCLMFTASPLGEFDGRQCEDQVDCLKDQEPGAHYACEHIGLFGSTSVKQRVRWLGIIQDPNELAMYISICLPLMIGLWLLRPSRLKGALFVAIGLLVGLCVVYTQSRGGQIVFIVALGVYFVRRFGVGGAVACMVASLPLLLLGGRSGEEADASKMERIEALYVAMTLMSQYPLYGVGWGNFDDYNIVTAHNSYALSAAELGLPGLFLFVALLYLLMKIFISAVMRYEPVGPSRGAYIWGGALAAALAGLLSGIFLLSFNVHQVLWLFLGVGSGFGLAVQRHDPTFEIKMTRRDYAIVAAISVTIATMLFTYSRYQVGHHH